MHGDAISLLTRNLVSNGDYMLADLVDHHASTCHCGWAVLCCKANSTRVLSGATCHCPCCDIASAGLKATPFLVQIMWLLLGSELVVIFADSNISLLCC